MQRDNEVCEQSMPLAAPADNITENITNRQRHLLNRHSERTAALEAKIALFTPGQKTLFDSVKDMLVAERSSTDPGQLLHFISGGAGNGKSFIIQTIIEYVRLHYGKNKGLYGSVLALAPTGCAASNIGGFTWQSALGCGRQKRSKKRVSGTYLSNAKASEVGSHIQSMKLLVIDEVSMISMDQLYEISQRIVEAKCTKESDPARRAQLVSTPFAGIHVIFCGDLYQLKCIGHRASICAYKNLSEDLRTSAARRGAEIWYKLNRYTELTESCRFGGHSPLEMFLNGARVGKPNINYLDLLNERKSITILQAIENTHPNALWLASTKAEVTHINNYMYDKMITDGNFAFDVIATHTCNSNTSSRVSKGGVHMSDADMRRLYNYPQKMEDKDKFPLARIKLAVGSRVKITENIATQLGTYCIV